MTTTTEETTTAVVTTTVETTALPTTTIDATTTFQPTTTVEPTTTLATTTPCKYNYSSIFLLKSKCVGIKMEMQRLPSYTTLQFIEYIENCTPVSIMHKQ